MYNLQARALSPKTALIRREELRVMEKHAEEDEARGSAVDSPARADRGATSSHRDRLTPKLMLQLAAPHTWPGSIMPVLGSVAMAYSVTGTLQTAMALLLLAICVLMQSTANALNDHFDFKRGADSEEDDVAVDDAVLVYNDVNPRSVLIFALGMLACAFALGVIVIIHAGWVPLAIALIGAIVVALYSGGKTPISFLPIGEAVSGTVMGLLIPAACFYVLTDGMFTALVILWSIPFALGIGLIMLTNNTCDIEKDIEAGRRTLPACVGRQRARDLYHILLVLWVLLISLIVLIQFERGLWVILFMLFACIPLIKALWANPLLPKARIAAMGQICSVNVALGTFYAFALAF